MRVDTWHTLGAELDAAPGTVSLQVGRPGEPPSYRRLPDVAHGAASTMKVAVLIAAFRAAERGLLDLDTPVPVGNDFPSALGDGSRYRNDVDYDDEAEVWTRLGGVAPLRWLARRMIVGSSNLATNIVIGHVGLSAVEEVWRSCGAMTSTTRRGIEDYAARDAGLDNVVSAADLAALFGCLELGSAGPARACAEMLDILAAQEHRVDLATGLPTGVRIAHKNGWMPGVRHSAGIVYPADAPPYAVAVCTSADADPAAYDDEAACRLIARISAVAWALRAAASAA